MTELELTYPPSVNHYYTKWCQYVKKAGKHVVKVAVGERGMAYRAEVRRFKLVDLKNPQPLKGRLSMEVQLWAPDRRSQARSMTSLMGPSALRSTR